MSSVVLPHKRRGLYAYDDNMPEQTPEKRMKKIDDFPKVDRATYCNEATTHQIVVENEKYGLDCKICGFETDHTQYQCPQRPKFLRMACTECREPCEIKEHQDMPMKPRLFSCFYCGALGDHWSKDCPDPIWKDCDFF
ncbi:hypothetical protein AgCh_015082 [Apium graveolens]